MKGLDLSQEKTGDKRHRRQSIPPPKFPSQRDPIRSSACLWFTNKYLSCETIRHYETGDSTFIVKIDP
jgi:hypothetical protein